MKIFWNILILKITPNQLLCVGKILGTQKAIP